MIGSQVAYQQLMLSRSCCWKFSVTMASRFEIVDEEYIEELKDQQKRKHEEKHRVLEQRFQKVGEWKKLPSKFTRVREWCPWLNTVAVLCRVLKRKWGWLWVWLLKVTQASLYRYLKSKAYPTSIIQDREFLNSTKGLEGKDRKLRKQDKRKRPNRSGSLTKKRGISPLAERPAWRRNSTSSA